MALRTDTGPNKHTHGLTQVDAAQAADAARMKAIEDRLTKLETPTVPPDSPPSGSSVLVTSVASLLSAAADDAVGEVVVRNGTYNVIAAGNRDPQKSLWIGAAFAGRKNPLLVRAETNGSVIFDGNGSNGALSFGEAAHDQTWRGFVFDDFAIRQTGAITFGGWPTEKSAQRITLDQIRILPSVRGGGGTATATDHGVYIAGDSDSPRDLTFSGITIDCSGGLHSGFHLYKAPNVQRFRAISFAIKSAQQAIMVWESSVSDALFQDGIISGSLLHALSYRHPATNVRLVNVDSTGSGSIPVDAPDRTGLTIDPSCSLA